MPTCTANDRFSAVPRRRLRALLAALALAPLAACSGPLAVRDGWFAPPAGEVARVEEETRAFVQRHRALQAARWECPYAPPPPAEAAPPGPPGSGGARVCPPPGAAPGAHGAGSNAYRRWAGDAVRQLPALSATAAGAAGE